MRLSVHSPFRNRGRPAVFPQLSGAIMIGYTALHIHYSPLTVHKTATATATPLTIHSFTIHVKNPRTYTCSVFILSVMFSGNFADPSVRDQKPFINYLKTVLEDNYTCKEHGSAPVVSLSDNAMTISCCCDQAHDDCVKLAKHVAGFLRITGLAIK
ncbi:MAG: hypothetical protein JSU01_12850 [Bacteroidetes bacterium]|nr:hypothetical protein [Bacteroidota bacterium]